MKTALKLILVMCLLVGNPVNLLANGRLFQRNTGHHCTTHHCNNVQAIAVAAVPLTTIPLAVDLQAYQYSVNRQAFTQFQNYAVQQYTQAQQVTQAAPVQSQTAQLQLDDKAIDAIAQRLEARLSGQAPSTQQLTQEPQNQSGVTPAQMQALGILHQNCSKCHNDGNKQGNLAMFSQTGGFYTSTSMADVAKRIMLPLNDPQHMPPGVDLDADSKSKILFLAIPSNPQKYNPFGD
jgi:hypothetical protein